MGDNNRKGNFIKQERRYQIWLQSDFETVELRAGKLVKNIFDRVGREYWIKPSMCCKGCVVCKRELTEGELQENFHFFSTLSAQRH